jgi:serine/threonine-protein kinase HipA
VTTSEVMVVLDDAHLGAPIDAGVLRHERRGSAEVVRFSYSDTWLQDVPEAFPIDPELPLFGGDQFPAAPRELFGVFRDASPDRWGRVLMERREALQARTQKRKPARVEDEVRAAFEDWTSIAQSCGIQRREIERLEAVIDPTMDG